MAYDFRSFFSGTVLGSIIGSGRSRNDRYTSQPNFNPQHLSFNKREQWVTINNNENEIYNTTAELKLVLDRMALMFSNGVWKHVDGEGKDIENSDFLKLLENPNLFQSRNEWLFQYYVQRGLYGNAFGYESIASQLQEVPSAVWWLAPSRMTINRTGKIYDQTTLEGMISSYTFKMLGEGPDVEYKTDDIIQFSNPDSDDPLMGKSPLQSIRMQISNIRAAYGYRNVILTKKGAIGVWSSDAKDSMGAVRLTEQEETDLVQQLVKTYGIGDYQNSVAISRSALKWNPSTYPTKDLMLFEEVDANFLAIIDLYGGNKNMFSAGKDSTFNNVDMGERQAYQNTIVPQAADLSNGLSKRWDLLEKDQRLILDYSHLPVMKDDEVKKSQILERKARAAVALANIEGLGITPSDILAIIDLEPES